VTFAQIGRTFYRVIVYNIDVESVGGADYSFRYTSERELRVNEPIEDHLGRGYVVTFVSPDTHADPRNPDILLGFARARPTT
jgi:hypothetical protein